MATLADELAADLDFSSDEEEQQQGSDIDEEQEALDRQAKEEDIDMDSSKQVKESSDTTFSTDLGDNPNSVKRICKLLYSNKTQDVLNVILSRLL